MPESLRHRSWKYITFARPLIDSNIVLPDLPNIISDIRMSLGMASIVNMSTGRPRTGKQSQEIQQDNRQKQTKEKKPPLTHFLCLPLISNTSLPQLEESISEFKRRIPRARETTANQPTDTSPLFPDSAIRPLGTLHLTLGVMSLRTPERVNEAIKFLQSLDVGSILQEAESEIAFQGQQRSTSQDLLPISVSLRSLEPLPKAKAATVLYTSPVDPTSRLYPFADRLRNAFVEAGFIEQDVIKQTPKKQEDNNQAVEKSSEGNEYRNKEIMEKRGAESEEDGPTKQKPKFRPLLLHATLVNTIYARREHTQNHSYHASTAQKSRRHGGPSKFDARNIVAHYRDFYTDDTCMHEKNQVPPEAISDPGTFLDDEDGNDAASRSSDEEAHPSKAITQLKHSTGNEGEDNSGSRAHMPKHPFIWARNVPIERLCICEMGAKNLDKDSHPLAATLGQEYRVVAEKRLF